MLSAALSSGVHALFEGLIWRVRVSTLLVSVDILDAATSPQNKQSVHRATVVRAQHTKTAPNLKEAASTFVYSHLKAPYSPPYQCLTIRCVSSVSLNSAEMSPSSSPSFTSLAL